MPPAHDRMAVSLTLQQDEDAGRDGEDRQDHPEAIDTQKLDQAPGDEKDSQQEHAYVSGDVHGSNPFYGLCG